MSLNAQRMTHELTKLNYQTNHFRAPTQQGSAVGVRFEYQIKDGSRTGDTVTLAIAVHENEGEWPEVAPHWVYISPPDTVLSEQVEGSNYAGSVAAYQDEEGTEWMVISAPPRDFWDQIKLPNGKNMATYLENHIRRIWRAR